MSSKAKKVTDPMEPLTTALSVAAAKAAMSPIAKFIKDQGLEQYNKITATFQNCFQGHVEHTLARCSKMKNILYRDLSVDFLSQYVNIEFSGPKSELLEDATAVSRAIGGERLLVCGTAGAGKTMFMRWSALHLIKNIKKHGRVPLFLEMRYFEEEYGKHPIEKYIYDKTSAVVDAANFTQFEYGLKSGLFIILLDAIDEINPKYREQVVLRIMDFVRRYPECGLMISSRFDEKLESIQEFMVLHSRPMNRGQIVEVIEKLDYDVEVKTKLIDKLNGGLYEELNEFLSNPLLATIMLLSFDHSADIPTKLTAFYQQAFDALYQRHDAAKGAYKRAHYAGLPIDRFQNVFSTFSFQTYLNFKFEFSDSELSSAMREACEYNQEDVDPELLIRDSMESVCLIQREGWDNVFSHRSFQEYFCALFISKYREADVGNLIEAIATMENRSNILRMLYELAPEVFEYEWVLPLLNKYIEDFNRVRFRTKSGLRKGFEALCDSIEIDLEANSPATIVWPPHSVQVRTKLPGRWMSSIQTATQGRLNFFNNIFGQKVWVEWEEFLESLPNDVRPSDEYLAEITNTRSYRDEALLLSVTATDAPWLIYSELPLVFENLRVAVKKYRDEIIERRTQRLSAVKGLLVNRTKGKDRFNVKGRLGR